MPLPAQAPARPVRQAGLQQGPRALRRPGPVLHLRRGGPQRGDRRVVPRRRHPHPRGLRHDRERRRRARSTTPTTTRSAPSAPPLPGSEVKLGEGDEVHDQGPARHGRLPQPPRGDREDAHRGRLAAHRRQGRRSTPTASSRSPAGSRTCSRPPAASTSLRRRSSRSSRRSAPTPASSWCSATRRNFVVALITLDPDAMAGWAAENGMEGKSYSEIVGSEQVQDDGRRLRRRSSTRS